MHQNKMHVCDTEVTVVRKGPFDIQNEVTMVLKGPFDIHHNEVIVVLKESLTDITRSPQWST